MNTNKHVFPYAMAALLIAGGLYELVAPSPAPMAIQDTERAVWADSDNDDDGRICLDTKIFFPITGNEQPLALTGRRAALSALLDDYEMK